MKTAYITGATSGFGHAIAHKFAAQGFRLIITGRRKDRLVVFRDELQKQYGVEVFISAYDLQDRIATESAIALLPAGWQEIDILVNNAGLAVGKASIENGEAEDWDRMIDTNVKGLLYVTRALIPYIKNSPSGHIVNIGSIAGTEVYGGGNVYCASKHAVNAISKALRIELLPYGIRVSQIRPGLAETEFSVVRFKGDQGKADHVYTGFDALKAQDIADVVWFIVNAPAHVCINDLEITPTAQANAALVERNNSSR